MRCFIELSYVGTAYHGWQRQPESVSVQEVLEDTLSDLIGSTTIIVGCGRTDTGVHASTFYAHFDWDGVYGRRFKDWAQGVWKLNLLLRADNEKIRAFYEALGYEVEPRLCMARSAPSVARVCS